VNAAVLLVAMFFLAMGLPIVAFRGCGLSWNDDGICLAYHIFVHFLLSALIMVARSCFACELNLVQMASNPLFSLYQKDFCYVSVYATSYLLAERILLILFTCFIFAAALFSFWQRWPALDLTANCCTTSSLIGYALLSLIMAIENVAGEADDRLSIVIIALAFAHIFEVPVALFWWSLSRRLPPG